MFGFQPIAFNYTKTTAPDPGGCVPVNFPSDPPVFTVTVNTFNSINLNIYNNGGAATSWTITTGSLPDGMTLNTSTGFITGTPTSEANYSLFINATNSCTETSQGINLEIQVGPGI